jgi:hypothetical protein
MTLCMLFCLPKLSLSTKSFEEKLPSPVHLLGAKHWAKLHTLTISLHCPRCPLWQGAGKNANSGPGCLGSSLSSDTMSQCLSFPLYKWKYITELP